MLFQYRIKKQNKKRIRARISAILICAEIISMLSFMTGCGSSKAEVPELNEPVVAESAYRPVSKRIVGRKELMFGTVVPREYPCIAREGIELAELNVAIGDYVKKGDVIATGVTSASAETIKTLNNEIASLGRQRTNTKNVSDKTIEKLNYEKKIEEYLENNDGVQEKEKEIATEQENQRYNLAVIDNSISSKRTEISELQEKDDEKTITAPISGYVSFVKDLSESNHVESNENIAVIYDPDELYIESNEKTIDNYDFEDYESKWAYIDGEKVDITERRYTNEEVSYAKSVKCNPYIQFEVPGKKLTMGIDVVLYFMNSDDTPKLAIGTDSIYRENDEEYVYVKGPEGSSADEKRLVKLGATDGKYTEVISGLEEGELVYYRNTAAIPKTYEEATAGLADYQEKCETEFISIANPYSKIYTADYSGKIEELHIVGEASEGDSLYTLQTNVGVADIAEVKDTLEDLDTSREKTRKEYEKNKSDLEEIIKGADKFSAEDMATDSDAIHENMYLAERTQCELDILNYNENYSKEEYNAQKAIAQESLNDLSNARQNGEPVYSVNSDVSGNINTNGVARGTKVEKYQYIMTEQYRKEEDGFTRMHVIVDSKDPSMPNAMPKIGEDITLFNKDHSWDGKCLGINGSEERFILFTQGEQEYSTYSKPFFKGIEFQFDFRIEDEISKDDLEGAKVRFYGKDMRQVVVVPSPCVKTEYDQMAQKDLYYVWKIENGEIVKEYVTIYETTVATGTTYIMDGVEVGDKLLK